MFDLHKTPREVTNTDKKGAPATVNIEANISLFLKKDLSDKSKASPEDAVKDNEVAATTSIETIVLDSDTSGDASIIMQKFKPFFLFRLLQG